MTDTPTGAAAATKPIKLTIHLTVEGQEALVKGLSLYAWNFQVVRIPADGVTNAYGEAPAPEGYLPIGELEVSLPSKDVCIPAVLASLAKREKAIMAECQEDLHKLAVRRAELLALPAPAAPSTEVDFDDSSY